LRTEAPTLSSIPSAKPKSFKVFYLLALIAVALTSALAVYAGVAPEKAATLTHGLDTRVAVFLVPLGLLMLATIGEVVRVSLRGAIPGDDQLPVRSLRWQDAEKA